jgi:photosystem II cytochrome c550
MKNTLRFLASGFLVCFNIFLFTPFTSFAIELDDAVRTVPLNSTKNVLLTPEQVKRGKRLFVNTCSICHTGGITKTNPNVGLDSEALS